MNDRIFSDTVQYQAVLKNLEKNNGQLRCEICKKILTTKAECRFDHILAYAKGGQSTLDNCQILCENCNLSKSDKDLQDYLLEEKAKRFMSGETINIDTNSSKKEKMVIDDSKMTKEKFDEIVGAFINQKGNIKKVDFSRDKNDLPSVTYIKKYYGSINDLKVAFGLEIDIKWTRENIWDSLSEYSKINPDFKQSDLIKANNLPSLPCILSHYPEYKNFTEIKTALGLDLNYKIWSKEEVFNASKEFLKTHNKITLKDLKKENGLPTSKVIYNFFGTMKHFQEEIGSEISTRNEYISKEELLRVTNEIIDKQGDTFNSRADFLKIFPYSMSVILNRFNSFDRFAKVAKISIVKTKKAKYTKQEVDDIILTYLKNGKPIPASSKQLSSLNLPSASTILRFYDSWKEPFLVFQKMIHITNN